MKNKKQDNFFSEENTCKLLDESLEDLKAHFRGEPNHCREMEVSLSVDGSISKKPMNK
ncbi:MAG: hypothetical protein R3Y63_08680 [Eubacteriales bacterium]